MERKEKKKVQKKRSSISRKRGGGTRFPPLSLKKRWSLNARSPLFFYLFSCSVEGVDFPAGRRRISLKRVVAIFPFPSPPFPTFRQNPGETGTANPFFAWSKTDLQKNAGIFFRDCNRRLLKLLGRCFKTELFLSAF